MAYDSYAPTTKAAPCQDRRAEARRGNAFWVVLGGGAPASPFTVLLPDGREAMALFSSEEEARMFCHCGKEGADHLRFRETSTGEVLSLLFCPWCPKHVILDPLPEVLGGGLPGLSELLALDRQSFARSFCGDQARGPKRSPSLGEGFRRRPRGARRRVVANI
jgi:hypothetical protein